MAADDLLVEVRNASLEKVGVITASDLKLEATIPFNGVGGWSLTLAKSHPMTSILSSPGGGIVVSDLLTNKVLFSGPAIAPEESWSFEDQGGNVVISGITDEIILEDRLAFSVPSSADLEAQEASTYDTRTGAAETLMHQYVNANIGPGGAATRRHPSLGMGTDRQRGGTVTHKARFENLLTTCQTLAKPDVLGFRVVQYGSSLRFETFAPVDNRANVRLTFDTDTLVSSRFAQTAPGTTRAIVVGDGGAGTKFYIERTSAKSMEAEQSWGRRIEKFVDASSSQATASLERAGDEQLATDGYTGISATFEPGERFRGGFGKDWMLGDWVSVLIGDTLFDAPVSALKVKADSEGLRIGAELGDVSSWDQVRMLANRIDDAARIPGELIRNEVDTTPKIYEAKDAADQALADAAAAGDLAAAVQLALAEQGEAIDEDIADILDQVSVLEGDLGDVLTAAQLAQATADGAIRTYYQANPPWANGSTQPSSSLGDLWYDSDNDQAHRWNGTTWAMIEDNSIAAALLAAENAADAATTAQESADGKNTVWHGPTAPSGSAHAVDDTWFETDNGNKIHKWDGDSWEPVELGTNAIANLSITNALIADGTIQNAKIGNLDAGKLTTGSLDAGRISANSITVDKLTIGSISGNKVPNGDFEDGLLAWTTTGTANGTVDTVASSVPGGSGGTTLRITKNATDATNVGLVTESAKLFPVTPDASRTLWVSARARANATYANGFYLRVNWFDAAKASLTSTTPYSNVGLTSSWQLFEAQLIAPAGAAYARITLLAGAANSVVYVDDVLVREVVATAQIADDGITAAKLKADAISAKHTITGPLFQTNAAANRGVKIVSSLEGGYGRLVTYDAAGAETFVLNGQTGAVTMTGGILSGGTITGAGFTNNKVTISGDSITLSESAGSLKLDTNIVAGFKPGAEFQTGSFVGETPVGRIRTRIWMDEMSRLNLGDAAVVTGTMGMNDAAVVLHGRGRATSDFEAPKYGGGMQMGGATIPITAVNTLGTVNVTFPTAFSSSFPVPKVFLTLQDTTHASAQIRVSVANVTRSGCTIQGIRSVGTNNIGVDWLAVVAAS